MSQWCSCGHELSHHAERVDSIDASAGTHSPCDVCGCQDFERFNFEDTRLLRTACPECGRSVPVVTTGNFRQHHTGHHKTHPICSRSGTPIADFTAEQYRRGLTAIELIAAAADKGQTP